MFLHNREASKDFFSTSFVFCLKKFKEIVSNNRQRFNTGVIHSFFGSQEDLDNLIALDLYISVSAYSLKTDANLEVVKNIPLDRLLLESGL